MGGFSNPHSRQQDQSVNVINVATSTYTLENCNIKNGINVVRVTYNGAVTIYIPIEADPQNLIYVNRESGTGTITITGV